MLAKNNEPPRVVLFCIVPDVRCFWVGLVHLDAFTRGIVFGGGVCAGDCDLLRPAGLDDSSPPSVSPANAQPQPADNWTSAMVGPSQRCARCDVVGVFLETRLCRQCEAVTKPHIFGICECGAEGVYSDTELCPTCDALPKKTRRHARRGWIAGGRP
jgi:hypothetical protein